MKAAVLTKLNAPLDIIECEPVAHKHDSICANGQVLVNVTCSGICGSQLKEISGEKNNEQFLPHMLGHEGCGIIRDIGQGVSVQLKGRKCVIHWRKGAGPEAWLPARYDIGNGKTIGGGHVTTLCEQAVVSANRVTVVPDDVPDELCALLGCGLSTALGTIEQEAKLRFGESILIVGCGGVGLNLIQAAKLACAYPIVGMDVTDEKREVCMKLGAHLYINTTRQFAAIDAVAHFRETTRGFDCIVDTSGSIEALEKTMPLLADGGRFICVGQPKPGQDLKIIAALNMFAGDQGRRIIWTQGGGFRPSVDIPRWLNLWRAGYLSFENIISHSFSLADVNQGIELVRAGQAGRVMISMKE